jgi:hypothetical protein
MSMRVVISRDGGFGGFNVSARLGWDAHLGHMAGVFVDSDECVGISTDSEDFVFD